MSDRNDMQTIRCGDCGLLLPMLRGRCIRLCVRVTVRLLDTTVNPTKRPN